MLFLLSYLNLPLFYLFKISGSKMDLKSLFRYFITKEKLAFSLYLLGIASYFPQHILYFLPLPHGCQCLVFLPLSNCSFPYITVYFSLVLFSNYRLSLLKMVLKVVLKHHFFHIFYSLLQLNYIIITLIYLSNLTYF